MEGLIMPLWDFFRINMPYGVIKTPKGWTTFNREYQPLGRLERGLKQPHFLYSDDEVFSDYRIEYKGLTEKIILSIVDDKHSFKRDKTGVITEFFFYNDATNPENQSTAEKRDFYYERYFEKIKRLGKLKRVYR
ncbi:MAG: hypothetical protein R6W78_10435 [Bacteroidales bacterium]